MYTPQYISTLPSRTSCCDALGAGMLLKRSHADSAVTLRHLQPNAEYERKWMVFDVDKKGAWFLPDEVGLPTPNYIATNCATTHAHIGYLLETPVGVSGAHRDGPRRFYEAVYRGFSRRLGADPCYTGFLTKNPVHPHWLTDWRTNMPQRLDELNDSLSAEDKRWRPKTESESPIGRNCSLFDGLRAIAYKSVLKFKKAGDDLGGFREYLTKHAMALNAVFDRPLFTAEVAGIVRSVAKWCWKEFTLEKFSAIQSARVQKRWGAPIGNPWVAMGISRRTWQRRKAAGTLVYPDTVCDTNE